MKAESHFSGFGRLLGAAVALLVMFDRASAQDHPSAENLLQQLYGQVPGGVTLDAAVSLRQQRGADGEVLPIEAHREQVYIDFRAMRTRLVLTDYATQDVEPSSHAHSAADHRSMEHIASAEKLLGVVVDHDGVAVSSKLQPGVDAWERTVSGFQIFAMFGYLPIDDGGESVVERLHGMSLEATEDAGLVVLQGRSSDAQLSVWLEPSIEYAARRVVYRRSGRVPDGRLNAYEYSVREFQRVDGHSIPREFDIVAEYPARDPRQVSPIPGTNVVLPAQPRIRMTSEYVIDEIEINPGFSDSDFELQTEIPDGTFVLMDDARHLKYEWQDGEVVASIDAQAERMAREARFLGGAGSARFWLVLVSVAVLVLVGCVAWRRHRAF